MNKSTDLDALFDQWKERIDALIQEHPLHIISWEATRRCNLRCLHCGSPSEAVDLGDELTTDEIVGAFEQIAIDFDMSRFRHINITGGEPFVRKDLLEVLGRINKWSFYRNIDIQTNGIFLADNPAVYADLKALGVTGLGISIDGLEQSHDDFRRQRGSFAKACEAARLGVENGFVVTVSVVAHAKNTDEIPALFDFVKKEIKPRIFRVMTIDAIGRAEHETDCILSPQQLRQVIDFLMNEYQSSCARYADKKTTMVELGCGGWLGTELEGRVRPFIFHCIAGLNNLGILFDGKLGSCSNISRDFIQGDIRTERIESVWKERYQQYREFIWKKSGDCVVCDQWDFCQGGPFHKRVTGGTLNCIYTSMKHLSREHE